MIPRSEVHHTAHSCEEDEAATDTTNDMVLSLKWHNTLTRSSTIVTCALPLLFRSK